MSNGTAEQVLASIVRGVNGGDLDSLLPLYEPKAAFATQPGTLNHGPAVLSDPRNAHAIGRRYGAHR